MNNTSPSKQINLKDIRISYSNQLVLSFSSLEFSKGENYFIQGPSGSGKTTFLNLLLGLKPPDHGQVEIDSVSLYQMSKVKRDRFRSQYMGCIFQEFLLIPYLNVIENILLPSEIIGLDKNISREKSMKLIDKLQMRPFINKSVEKLSVGQKQRVAIARALINSAPIILADEPTSALDDQNAKLFIDLILEMQKEENFTLILISHDKRPSSRFDNIIDMTKINILD